MSDNKYFKLAEQLLLETPAPKNVNTTIPNPTIEFYEDVLRDGIPQTVQQQAAIKGKKVVVVGAGIAGLISAGLLSDAGADVKLVEANTRIGGRVKTFTNQQKSVDLEPSDPNNKHFHQDGLYAEAGAMRMPMTHQLLKYLSHEKLVLPYRTFKLVGIDPNKPQDSPSVKTDPAWISTNGNRVQKNSYYNSSQQSDTFDGRLKVNNGFEVTDTRTASCLVNLAFEPLRDMIEVGDTVTNNDERRQQYLEKWADLIEKFDNYSLQRYLREEATVPTLSGTGVQVPLTEEQIALIGTLENLTSRLPLALLHSFLGRFDISPNNSYYEFVGGSWRLPAAIYEHYNGTTDKLNLHSGQRVIAIKQHDNKVTAISVDERQSSDASASNEDLIADGQQHTGDALVLTMPFSSLRFVDIAPQFSFAKRRAITELHYDSATKVLLDFEQRWWEFDHAKWLEEINKVSDPVQKQAYLDELTTLPPTSIQGGGSISDGPSRFIYYPSHPSYENDLAEPYNPDDRGAELSGGVILAAYTWADDAVRWDALNSTERLRFALHELCIIHGERIKLFFNNTGTTQSWARNPYAFGEAAIFTPGQMVNLHPHIPTPEGNVFFAGEHTSLKHAWIEGAIESAVRVSLEVHSALATQTTATATTSKKEATL